jgi:hypothetical protein
MILSCERLSEPPPSTIGQRTRNKQTQYEPKLTSLRVFLDPIFVKRLVSRLSAVVAVRGGRRGKALTPPVRGNACSTFIEKRLPEVLRLLLFDGGSD